MPTNIAPTHKNPKPPLARPYRRRHPRESFMTLSIRHELFYSSHPRCAVERFVKRLFRHTRVVHSTRYAFVPLVVESQRVSNVLPAVITSDYTPVFYFIILFCENDRRSAIWSINPARTPLVPRHRGFYETYPVCSPIFRRQFEYYVRGG